MSKNYSLSQRLSIVSILMLVMFLGAAAWGLDRLYQRWVTTAVKEQSSGHIYSLLAAASEDKQGLPIFNDNLPDARLLTPDSGIYALIYSGEKLKWKSPSVLGREFQIESLFVDNKIELGIFNGHQDDNYFYLSYKIEWEALDGNIYPYHLISILDLKPYIEEARLFRYQLWAWLFGSGLLLLFIQLLSLRWAVKPLNAVAKEIDLIQSGQSQSLSAELPRELDSLKNSLNTLIIHNQKTNERYRNKLGDLAHSLKTPLAVMQNAYAEPDSSVLKAVAKDQLPRMNEILEYQLSKAIIVGQGGVLESIKIEPLLKKLISALKKVYMDKAMNVVTEIESDLSFQIDSGDLMELLGNLLDNAFKYGKSQIQVGITLKGLQLEIQLVDNGPGIDAAKIKQVLQRGIRLDESGALGQGIGLNIVSEIVNAYSGIIKMDQDEIKYKLSGIHIQIQLNPT